MKPASAVPPPLTARRIRKLLEAGIPGARELNEKLKEVFELSPEQRNLVLR
jgi:hypothetical protein